MNDTGSTILGFVIWALLIVAYWTPTIVALVRKVPNKAQVIAVNFFAFTFVCWVIALVWALKPIEPRPPYANPYPPLPPPPPQTLSPRDPRSFMS